MLAVYLFSLFVTISFTQLGNSGRSNTPWHASWLNSVQGGILQYPYDGTKRLTGACTLKITVTQHVILNV